ncbi:metalloprotease [Bacteroidia bacterium]|nr:metalloprotease [Bacteroidia bacterium]GHT62852.1 metalloprotease [Bacteroidia bacterium]
MQWQGRRESSNVEDRRGQSGGLGGLGGGMLSGGGCGLKGGIGSVVILLIIWALGGNPMQFIGMLGGLDDLTSGSTQQTYTPSAQDDEQAKFVKVVLAETEDVWTDLFQKMGRTYRQPTLVLYNQYTSSGCGTAQSSTGPFYCPEDEKIYVDLSFFRQMDTQFHAGGDFAYAYVLAHEVGHHVQKLLGTLDQANAVRARSNEKVSNELSVRTELQADFYAGIWAHYDEKYVQLDPGDIQEALNAASAVGDDRLQEQAQGYVVPDAFTHGTSQQRYNWFYKGYKTGDMKQGDTFNSPI